ncbi:iron ABC transporter permease [Marine Group III euryarchaeote]|nr:iron ABC transporter permease [Marine Group III euryarchaeote]
MDRSQKIIGAVSVFLYTSITIIPIFFALDRLILVSGFDPIHWVQALDKNYVSQNTVGFTFVQSFFSTILTIMLGFPIAWVLGRYSWPFKSFLRSILTLPFVIPAIIAAMGFLTITGPYGLDIRTNESTWWFTLILSHAWFNIALIIRFCEPVLSTLNPNLEEQLLLLPNGVTFYSRLKTLWIPILTPAIAAASCMTFVFSFTSFALVKWITVRDKTLESTMAEVSSSAGIQGYMESSSDIVLGASLIQFLVLLTSLWLMSVLQRNSRSKWQQANEKVAQSKNFKGWFILVPALFFVILPLISVIIGSLRVRDVNENSSSFKWSTEGWSEAFQGSYSFPPLSEALFNSLIYSCGTLIIAVPLGYALASTIHNLEEKNISLSKILEMYTMLPFALSAAMIGLGVMLGIIKLNPSAAYDFRFLPALAHIIITVPFVVRIILPALRSFDLSYDDNAKVLGINSFHRFLKIKLPLMRGSILVATVFTLAMSLGEFGASFIVARNSEWVTIPLLIDSLRGKPMKDPLTVPASNAVATVLMVITMILFLIVERFRNKNDRGMF